MKKLLALLFLAIATPAFADFTIILDAGKLRLNAKSIGGRSPPSPSQSCCIRSCWL
jgi:hypothetical protein